MRAELDTAIADIAGLAGRGDLLLAFDKAMEGLKTWPDSEQLKHAALLALARSGATAHAFRLFTEWNLAASSNPDVLAVEARLTKDLALKLRGPERRPGLGEAGAAYRRVHTRSPTYYTAINAASLAFLAGDRGAGLALARDILADPDVAAGKDYWALATRAEANLLLGDWDSASNDLTDAAAVPASAGDRASTRRQLKLILAEAGVGLAEASRLIAPLAPPVTVHFASASLVTGAVAIAPAVEAGMRGRIRELIALHRPGSAFGSIATPSEILFAEEILASGAQLELVVPLRLDVLRGIVLANAGAGWAARLDACCHGARRLVMPSDDPEAVETCHADYAMRVGMGLALLRAQHIDGQAVQVLLRDTPEEDAPGLVAAAGWIGHERRRIVIELGDLGMAPNQTVAFDNRATHALIFGDVPGFSSLHEQALPVFWETIMRAVGTVVDDNEGAIRLKNTWGDAVHFVVTDVNCAALICLAVQERLATIEGNVFGQEGPPTMRIGAHYGPVFAGWDPVVRQHTYFGRALSKAARIEPVTPPGAVYVSEAFAAILLLETGGAFTCTYAGQVPLAKGYGFFRMYDLVAA